MQGQKNTKSKGEIEMKFTAEQIAKMKAAKTAEELIAIAKAEGIEATEEQIEAQFAMLHSEGVLADEELENVSGGCGGPPPERQKKKNRNSGPGC